MKRIIIGLALIGCAMTASATKVNWGLAAGETITGITSGQMYLCYAASAADWSVLSGKDSFSTATLAEVGFTNVKETTQSYYDTMAYGEGAAQVVTLTPTSTGISGAKSFYTVVIASDGKTIAYTTSSFNATISTSTATVNVRRGDSSFTTVAAVPEPTSGLMLLLGFAGLALKRKRA